MPETASCRSCHRVVTWAKTAATGKRMPLDESADRGNVLIDEHGKAVVFKDHAAAVVELDACPERYSAQTFISHHAAGQCPEGPAWRGKRRTDPDAPQPPPEPVQGSLL